MPGTVETKTNQFIKRLQEATGENLESVILYGSAARGDFHTSRSDVNLLCVLRSLNVSELNRIAPVVKWWSESEKEPAPLIFTKEELRESADVFAIEMLDMQKHHRVIFGEDVVKNIEVPMNLHRVEVEHELRTLILKLRRHFLRASGNETEFRQFYAKSVSSALTLFRHVLIAFGEAPPAPAEEICMRVSQLTGADFESLAGALHARNNSHDFTELTRSFGRYVDAVGKVASAIDRHLPKQEWHRTEK